MADPVIDNLERRVTDLEKEVGNVSSTLPSLREAVGKLDVKTSMVHDEMDMFLKGLSNQSERMGEMREAMAGQREQQSAHHKENQNSFDMIRTGLDAMNDRLDPILEAFESPKEMGDVMRGARDAHVYQKSRNNRWRQRKDDVLFWLLVGILGMGLATFIVKTVEQKQLPLSIQDH